MFYSQDCRKKFIDYDATFTSEIKIEFQPIVVSDPSNIVKYEDFLEPLTFDWTEENYEISKSIKEYIKDFNNEI